MIRHLLAFRRLPAPAWMLGALVVGLAGGLFVGAGHPPLVEGARFVGGLWLDGLRMTVVPLVFALVVTGTASLRAEAGRMGARLIVAILALLVLAALVVALFGPWLLALAPLPTGAAAALRAGLAPAAPAVVPGTLEAVRALVPVNVVAAAAAGAIVPLVIFALVLGLALGRVEPTRAAATLAPLQGLADAMVVVVGWVLRAAPLGIVALTFAIGATAGAGAALMLGHYILVQLIVAVLLTAACYPVARAGRVSAWRFARAVAPAQAVAASTSSSIATLPAMLASAAALGVPERDAAVALPLSVAVFKITAPSTAMLVGLAMAWMAGVPVAPAQIALAVPVSLLSTFAVLGMPGVVSFIAATTPAALVMGAPLELLPVLMAVDTIPDIARTVANVTADLAVTVAAARQE